MKPIYIFEETEDKIIATDIADLKEFNLYRLSSIKIPNKPVVVKHARKNTKYFIISFIDDHLRYIIKENDLTDYHLQHFCEWAPGLGNRSLESNPLSDDILNICQSRGIKVFTAKHYWSGNNYIKTMYYTSTKMTDEQIEEWCMNENARAEIEYEEAQLRKQSYRELLNNNRVKFQKL